MKTLLVLAPHPEFLNSVKAALNPEEYRLLHRIDLNEAEALLGTGNIDAAILDVEQEDVRGLWTIEKLRRNWPERPVIIFAAPGWELTEDAYLHGVSFVLPKPVRRKLLNDVLKRTLEARTSLRATATPRANRASVPASLALAAESQSAEGPNGLQAFRKFSGLLTSSLNAEGMLQSFLQMLRESLSINRATIFLRPAGSPATSGENASTRTFKAACAMGLPMSLLDHFELAFDKGIGGWLSRTGRILRRDEAADDEEIEKEFEVLGAEVAVPILDRQSLIGVAAFDGRVTGEGLSNAELAALFHLLEQLGLALRNVWLHDQVAANHQVLSGILRELGSACVVIDRNLAVLHANRSARNYFVRRRTGELEFNDLPTAIGSKLYQVLQTGSGIAPFKFQPPEAPETVYQVAIVPLQAGPRSDAPPESVLLLVEDRTQAENLKRLEADATSLQQVKTIGGRLAHEINNAVMPLHLIQQELEKRVKDRDITSVFGDSVKRIARRGAQMRALAQDAILSRQVFGLAEVVQEAFEEAQKHQPGTPAKLNSNIAPLLMINGDREAIKLALMEVLLNAIQANAKDPKVAIRTEPESDTAGAPGVTLEVVDNGPGFSPEALQNAFKPFYTTKTVGLGVGLTVAEKIVSLHRGKLSIANATEGTGGLVRIKLPVELSAARERGEKKAA